MTPAALQSRFSFPYPTTTTAELRRAICWLMLDGKRRSVLEIQEALGTRKEIGARIRELRSDEYDAWPFNDARSDGPDSDGAFRYQLDLGKLTWKQRVKAGLASRDDDAAGCECEDDRYVSWCGIAAHRARSLGGAR